METEDFDNTVWQHLPFELLENVLTKLPVCALMTWCQVCKRLKTLIQSPEFARRCDSVFFHYAGDFRSRQDEGDSDDDNLPYLAIPNTKTNTWEKHTLNFASRPITVVAADQGLICFEEYYSKDNLFIYNPLTRQWKELRIPVEVEHQLRFIVRFDVEAGIWTADEPDLPYHRFVEFTVNPAVSHSDFPYTLLESERREPYGQLESKPPQWNFYLAPHDGVVHVMLFDSLIRREAFSGGFSSLIPEVKMVDADFVCKVRELADPPKPYMSTKVASQGEVWYVVFEYGGVRWHERGTTPLLVFAYSPRRNIWGWLPKLDTNSSCLDVFPEEFHTLCMWIMYVNFG
ncbi:hypothetical protein R1sor_009587 [Riccia sorocarpa]|uniref:F-box domain-containing protein n=1 Tax=Riccia sorocarpa TaxID=122646 RepID=A0ABD3HXC8_9MARC